MALNTHGWIEVKSPALGTDDAFKLSLLALGKSLGRPVTTRSKNLVDELTPKNKNEANPRSLSRITGTGRQPWHMDMAHRVEPARYLVMGMYQCATDIACTEILDAATLIPDALNGEALSEPFLVRTGARSFYATITSTGQSFVRFDPGCMQGATTRARALMRHILDQDVPPSFVHTWRSGAVLIIDNWKMLHRRADAIRSVNRALYRISVMGETT